MISKQAQIRFQKYRNFTKKKNIYKCFLIL